MNGYTVKQSPHSRLPGFTTAIYGPDNTLLKAGYEATKEEGLVWAATTMALMKHHPTLQAPDQLTRAELAKLDAEAST